ncbi:hypothetical protein O1M63_16920 [Streptomyces mirabilis]|nr:hypothetical protein [Streptomyces mirabilis]
MDRDDPVRRFLIATAVAHYARAPRWDRPGLVHARERIIELFTGALGYTHVDDLGLDPTREQLTSRLRAFCRAPTGGRTTCSRCTSRRMVRCSRAARTTSCSPRTPTRTTSPTPCPRWNWPGECCSTPPCGGCC